MFPVSLHRSISHFLLIRLRDFPLVFHRGGWKSLVLIGTTPSTRARPNYCTGAVMELVGDGLLVLVRLLE